MDALESRTEHDYLITILNYYDAHYYEVKARNVFTGKMYDAVITRKKTVDFYIYDNLEWSAYKIPIGEISKKNISTLKGLKQLEKAVNKDKNYPILYFKNGRMIANNSKMPASRIKPLPLPDLSFYFEEDLYQLDFFARRERYKYSAPPAYIIIGRHNPRVNELTKNSYDLYGCESRSIYDSIEENSEILVTELNGSEKAYVCGKIANEYGIIPIQHCFAKIS